MQVLLILFLLTITTEMEPEKGGDGRLLDLLSRDCMRMFIL